MLRIGIVGTGGIADAHIEAYLEFPEICQVVALTDLVSEKAAAKRERFGLSQARVFSTAAELFRDAGVDVVSIATPPSSHASLAVEALEAGIHTIVEKPMAPSLAECDRMLEAQEQSGKLLTVVAQNRFRDDMAILKAVLESGEIGSLSHIRIDSAWWRGLPYYDLWWRGTWESEGGGPTLNHAIHHIDLMLWLLGKPESVFAMMSNAQHDNAEVEDLSVALFRYGRALAQLTSSVVHHGEEQQIVIQGEHARVSQPWSVLAEESSPNGFPSEEGNATIIERLENLRISLPSLAHTGHSGQIHDFLMAVQTEMSPLLDGHDGRNAVEVVTAIYQSGIEERVITLPITEQSPFYFGGEVARRAPRYHQKRKSIREQDGAIIVGSSKAADESTGA